MMSLFQDMMSLSQDMMSLFLTRQKSRYSDHLRKKRFNISLDYSYQLKSHTHTKLAKGSIQAKANVQNMY